MLIEILLAILIILCLAVLFFVIKNSGSDQALLIRELQNSITVFSSSLEKIDKSMRDDFQRSREEFNKIAKDNRDELSKTLREFSDTFSKNVREFNEFQKQKFDDLSNRQTEMNRSTEERLEKVRKTVEDKLQSLQEDNNQKLEKMRETVDEKLHKTLEQRLGESFKLVSDRLEKVQKGLGEMQSLANGVGDLKKVLSNVKTRGVLGEYQLANILEQLLTPEQYDRNVKTKPSSNAYVEFAIKIPSKKSEDKIVWLPVDSKFPIENYQRLLDAYESGDAPGIENSRRELERNIKSFAKDIHEKYVDPPNTTDFAIMFLPVESLYAEVLRTAGLFEFLQREYRITITGPTTLAALLNSLQMGFRTLAIEKRSSEVWEILGAVKTEFGKFGEVLAKTKDKLDQASKTIDTASVRSRAIERKLRDVQELPASQADKLLEDGE